MLLLSGKLDLLQSVGESPGVQHFLAIVQERLQSGTQCFALGQLDPRLQALKHSLHGPPLPVLKGHAVDLQLPAHFRRFASVGPDRQNRLSFFRRGESRRWWTTTLGRL